MNRTELEQNRIEQDRVGQNRVEQDRIGQSKIDRFAMRNNLYQIKIYDQIPMAAK